MESIEFELGGLQVVVHSGHFMILAVFFLLELHGGDMVVAVGAPIIVFSSILWHELGHAWAARGLSVPVGAIELHGFGGHVTHGATTPGKQLAISLAGPAAQLAVGVPMFLAYDAAWWPGGSQGLLMFFIFVNIGWPVLNLLPMLPLDGGNALRSLITLVTRRPRMGLLGAGVVGVVLGGGLSALSYRSGEVFLAVLCGYSAFRSYQAVRVARAT